MCLLIETICYENGCVQRLELHNERMNRSRFELFQCLDEIDIRDFVHIPEAMKDQKIKCRVKYSTDIESVEYELYKMKPVNSLKLVYDNMINYQYKYMDRSELQNLFGLKENSDDILIVKNELISDTSYANIVFRKDWKWFTPSKPLLAGTRREFYIRSGIIVPIEIHPDNLPDFDEARIINAMISIDEAHSISIDNIFF